MRTATRTDRTTSRRTAPAVRRWPVLFASLSVVACGMLGDDASAAFDVTGRFPHDPAAYTQGLLWSDSVLFESTGLYGHSELRRVDLASGRVLASRPLPADRFGEGLALLNGRLYQLTWESGVAYSYEAKTLAPLDSFKYPGQGWGLATDGTSLIVSDGSDSLRFLSPETFQPQRVVHVRYKGEPLRKLNELEYHSGELLANVFESNWVLRIDPASGEVRELLDFTDLYADRAPTAEVMNGIAIAPDGQLLLTGKRWPTIFQVRIRPTVRSP
jgi:glutamine cyclotransferase